MIKDFTVNYDTDRGYDYDETFRTLREAMRRYNKLTGLPYKDLTCDDTERGTLTLLTSTGTNNLARYGFLPCDYN